MSPHGTYSSDGAWLYYRDLGWLPVPGTYPLPPRGDRPLRVMRPGEHVPISPGDSR